MSRRTPPPSDTFTRFTSTSPHAASASKPSSPSFSSSPPQSRASIGFNVPAPDGETPAQKVERLRAAARAAKERNALSGVDRMIDTGRRIADRAHRGFAYGLIGFTGIAAVLSVYSVISLVSHNRRQKRAWIERELDRLAEAQQAFLRGDANAEQLHLLEQERAGEEIVKKATAEKKRIKEAGWWSNVKGTFGVGMTRGDMGTGKPLEARGNERLLEEGWVHDKIPMEGASDLLPPAARSEVRGVGYDEKGRPVPAGTIMQAVTEQVKEERRAGENEVTARTGLKGGPLDLMAESVAERVTGGRDWMSWLRGSKS